MSSFSPRDEYFFGTPLTLMMLRHGHCHLFYRSAVEDLANLAARFNMQVDQWILREEQRHHTDPPQVRFQLCFIKLLCILIR